MSCDRQADAVVGQRDEELRETFHNVRHLDPHRHRALAQVKLLYAVSEEILVSARELRLSSRHLRDVSDKKGDVSLLRADQLLGRVGERLGSESFERLEVHFDFSYHDLYSLPVI